MASLRILFQKAQHSDTTKLAIVHQILPQKIKLKMHSGKLKFNLISFAVQVDLGRRSNYVDRFQYRSFYTFLIK